MDSIFALLTLALLVCIPLSLIRPRMFEFAFKKHSTREKEVAVFLGLVFLSILLLSAFTDPKSIGGATLGFVIFYLLCIGVYKLVKFLFFKLIHFRPKVDTKAIQSSISTKLRNVNRYIALSTNAFEKCPVCGSTKKMKGKIHSLLWGLINTEQFACQTCDAVFRKSGENYKLVEIANNRVKESTWIDYGGDALSIREWNTIANGGMSDAKQKEADRKAEEARQIALEKKRRATILSGNIKPIQTSVRLKAGELAYLEFNAEREVERSYITTHTIGKTTGKSKKKGVITRALVGDVLFGPVGAVIGGATAGNKMESTTTTSTVQETVTRTEIIDSGVMVFTNRRILFIGTEVIDIPYDNILAINFSSGTMTIKYPSMLRGEAYKIPAGDNSEIYFKGIMRLTGRDKEKVSDEN